MRDNTTLDILKSALLLEKKGKAFYQNVADKSDTPSVKQFFSFMAGEEEKHVEMLSQQFKSYQANGTFLTNNPTDNHNGVAISVIVRELSVKRRLAK